MPSKQRLTHEQKAAVRAAFAATPAAQSFEERLTAAYRHCQIPLRTPKIDGHHYPSQFKWLGVQGRVRRPAKLATTKPRRRLKAGLPTPEAAAGGSALSVEAALEVLCEAIISHVEARLSGRLVSAAASVARPAAEDRRPETGDRRPQTGADRLTAGLRTAEAAQPTTGDELQAELVRAKAAGDRVAMLRALDRIKRRDAADAALARDSNGED